MTNTGQSRRYIIILSAVAAGILVFGSAFRPESHEAAEAGSLTASPEAPFLQRLTLRRSVEESAEYFADLARRLEPHVTRLERYGRSGVVWDGGTIATAAEGGRVPAKDIAIRYSQRSWRVWPERVSPHLPAALLETSEEEPPRAAPRYSAGFFTAGGWAIVAWRSTDGELNYSAGHYLGPTTARCQGIQATILRTNVALQREMLGGGLFDVDGVLMGLVVLCGDQLCAIDVGSLERSFEPPQIISERLMDRYGVQVAELTPVARSVFQAEYGIQVTEVWEGWEARRAGLRPGDVILAVDNGPATSMADLEPLVLPVARELFDLQVLRNGSKRKVRLRARAEAAGSFGPLGLGLAEPAPGFRIEAVESGSAAAEAGLQAGDRLLWLNSRRPENLQALRTALDQADPEKPVFAIVQRGHRLWGAFLS